MPDDLFEEDLPPLPPMSEPEWIGPAPTDQIIEGRSITEEQAIHKALADLDRRRNGEIVGLPWPVEWPSLSRTIGPIEPGSLTVVASRPSVGKTMFGMQLLRSLAIKKQRVLYVSKELNTSRLIWRHMASYGADLYRLRSGQVVQSDIDAIVSYQRDSAEWSTFYDDHSKNIEDINTEILLTQPTVLIIDYLQRLAYDTEKEYAAITRIVNELQDLTLATNLPVILLSQLSRPKKGEEFKPPTMSDLRGSGAVEERAANIIILHRDWDTVDELSHDGKSKTVAKAPQTTGYFNVAKCADGESGKFIPVLFNGPRMKIVEKIAGLS
jgi:replicative DNA helicase